MFALTRKRKIAIIVMTDLLVLLFSNIVAYYFMEPFIKIVVSSLQGMMLITVVTYFIAGVFFKVFTRMNRYTNLQEILGIVMATVTMAVSSILLNWLFFGVFSKRMITFVFLLSTLLIVMSRLTWRLYIERKNDWKKDKTKHIQRTLVIGAGEGGRVLINSVTHSLTAHEIDIIGLVDDDPNKQRIYLEGMQVKGTIEDLPSLIKDHQIDMVTIAIPSLSPKRLREIITLLKTTQVKVNTMPSMEELASGKVSISRLKQIDVVDLLGREEVKLDIEQIKDQLTDKVILVTGAGGSIGSEICRQVMQFTPKTLLLLGHGENSIYLIER
ncbi:polysaccharide biosynthesis protein, partial [Jeotgalibaca porci]|uniref:nucleoside-diphosphate sugar epimerase/dehydratase n=1 Tax=Jeotgalibaca porci TaxID=1868793 RepID=UPI0035A0F6D8